mgnify:FL=1
MALDKYALQRIASLARLKIPENELVVLEKDLNNILGWVEQLSEVNTDDVDPMIGSRSNEMVMRRDEVVDEGCPEDILTNSQNKRGNFFTVPKVVE